MTTSFTFNGATYKANGNHFFMNGKPIKKTAYIEAEAAYKAAEATAEATAEENAKAEEEAKAKADAKAAKAEARAEAKAKAIEAIEAQVVAAFNRFTKKVATLEGDNTTRDKREAARPHTFMSFQYNGKALFEVCWSGKGVRVVGKTKLFGDRAPEGSKVINNGSLDLYIPTFRDNIEDTIYQYAVICSGIEAEAEGEATEEAKEEVEA